jgi:GNAT superfamily N-acetyltransferase
MRGRLDRNRSPERESDRGLETGMNHRIGPMQRKDVPAVKALIAEIVLEFYSDLEFLPGNPADLLAHYAKTGYLDDLDAFESVYAKDNGIFLVLEDDSGIQGCGGLRRLQGDQGELTRLWLRKDRRGLGLGREIVAALLRAAAGIGYREIYLDTSHRCSDAVRLFRKNGFSECPRYKESIGDIYMRKVMEVPE